jgi:hypothetical protein
MVAAIDANAITTGKQDLLKRDRNHLHLVIIAQIVMFEVMTVLLDQGNRIKK